MNYGQSLHSGYALALGNICIKPRTPVGISPITGIPCHQLLSRTEGRGEMNDLWENRESHKSCQGWRDQHWVNNGWSVRMPLYIISLMLSRTGTYSQGIHRRSRCHHSNAGTFISICINLCSLSYN